MTNFIRGFVVALLLALPIIVLSAPNLASRLQGKILMAVEDKGKTYYVHSDGNRYQITAATAQKIFEKLALGITNANLEQIPLKDVGINPEQALTCPSNPTANSASQDCTCDYTPYTNQIDELRSVNLVLTTENSRLNSLIKASSTVTRQEQTDSLNRE